MKLAFISDIHGNANALDSVLADIRGRNVDKIYVLGDICFRGPEPQRSLELVQSLNAGVIKGNADEWLIRGINEGEVPTNALEMMNKEREWICSRLHPASIDFLNSLPTELKLEFDVFKIHAYHATPKSLFEVIFPHESEENLITKMMVDEADLYIYAHIHKPYIRFINGKCIINAGSVGLPFDGLNKASYALIELDEGEIQTSIVRVEYDVNQTINQFIGSDYPNKEKMINILLNSMI